MFEKGFKRYLPSFITIAFELMEHWKRDSAHNNNIRKLNKTQEQLGVVEHMLVRLEKKIQTNHEKLDKITYRIYLFSAINFVMMLAILLKVTGAF